MTEKTGKFVTGEPADSREERLRAALRANLQRRKAQARARAAEADDSEPSDDEQQA